MNPTERTETAKAIRTELDDSAALINAAHARVLSQVITAQTWKVHRDLDGFSSLRDWLVSKFDFHYKTAADLAAIARNSGKFAVLTEAATSGAARVDQVAYATRALDKTPAMRLYAKTPYREAVASPSTHRSSARPRSTWSPNTASTPRTPTSRRTWPRSRPPARTRTNCSKACPSRLWPTWRCGRPRTACGPSTAYCLRTPAPCSPRC
ncbi:hypothetical protein GCM10029992_57290 [Glycomyces albus]